MKKITTITICALAFSFIVTLSCKSPVANTNTEQTKTNDTIVMNAVTNFTIPENDSIIPFYVEEGRGVLAIDAAKYPVEFANCYTVFNEEPAKYKIFVISLTESDGESTYRVYINNKLIGESSNPREKNWVEYTNKYGEHTLSKGDTIRVQANAHSNGLIPEGDAYGFSRGRWKEMWLVKTE